MASTMVRPDATAITTPSRTPPVIASTSSTAGGVPTDTPSRGEQRPSRRGVGQVSAGAVSRVIDGCRAAAAQAT
jgi:hypothetical protein